MKLRAPDGSEVDVDLNLQHEAEVLRGLVHVEEQANAALREAQRGVEEAERVLGDARDKVRLQSLRLNDVVRGHDANLGG